MPNVIALDQARSLRTKPATTKTYGRCRHMAVTVDKHTRSLECRECGATVDAFDYVNEWASAEDKELIAVKGLRDEANKLREEIIGLKRERANAKSALDRALIAENKARQGRVKGEGVVG